MTDPSIAFAPLEDRAKARDGTNPPDRISVRDHVVDVEIGAFQSERDVTQRLKFSVVVDVSSNSGATTDDVDDILSYDTITDAITAELQAERLNLLETLAERIADRILAEPQPLRVYVRIEKLDRGPGKLGVEIVRNRTDTSRGSDVADLPRPRVVVIPVAMIDDRSLSTFLRQVHEDNVPTIICMNAGAGDRRTAGPGLRVALLDLDRAAWNLAVSISLCVPVGSRTELDWGMKNDQLSVWTPSKMVLDAVDGPDGADPLDLAHWLATELQAIEMLVVDAEVPAECQIAARRISLEDKI